MTKVGLAPDQPTIIVFDNQSAETDLTNKKAVNGFSFEVPNVDPGRYLLLIYDWGEGGAHYRRPRPREGSDR